MQSTYLRLDTKIVANDGSLGRQVILSEIIVTRKPGRFLPLVLKETVIRAVLLTNSFISDY